MSNEGKTVPTSITGAGSALVVDDNPMSRRQLARALEEAGVRVTEAAEGMEGLWRARQAAFDIVITDVHMPTMDGLSFLRELRKLPRYGETPIYVLTSDCSKERLARGRELGATAWVVKPPNLPLLATTVRDAIRARRVGEAAPPPPGATAL